jgi:hypothetical protein
MIQWTAAAGQLVARSSFVRREKNYSLLADSSSVSSGLCENFDGD